MQQFFFRTRAGQHSPQLVQPCFGQCLDFLIASQNLADDFRRLRIQCADFLLTRHYARDHFRSFLFDKRELIPFFLYGGI